MVGVRSGAVVASAAILATIAFAAPSAQAQPPAAIGGLSISLSPSCAAPGQSVALDISVASALPDSSVGLEVSYLSPVLQVLDYIGPNSPIPAGSWSVPFDVPANAPWGPYSFDLYAGFIGLEGAGTSGTADLLVLPFPLCLLVASDTAPPDPLGASAAASARAVAPAMAQSNSHLALVP